MAFFFVNLTPVPQIFLERVLKNNIAPTEDYGKALSEFEENL
jgi:hypothetical protein